MCSQLQSPGDNNSSMTDHWATTGAPSVALLGEGWHPDRAGGLNRYLTELKAALSAEGVPTRAVVIGPVASPTPDVSVASRADARLGQRLFSFTLACRGARASEVVDAHFALYALLPVCLWPLRRHPLVVHFQGPWADESMAEGDASPLRRGAKRLLEKAVYNKAEQAVTLSGDFKRVLVERYGVSPWTVTVVPPGVDLRRFQPGDRPRARAALGIPALAPVVLSVRRLVARVGLDVLLDAWVAVSDAHPEAQLLIVGDGPLRSDLEEQASRLGISASVGFVGLVSESQLSQYYQAADVAVMPSVALEGFGLPVLEALASGTPVVTTDVGGMPDTVAGLDPSLVVAAGSSAELAARLMGAIDGSRPLPSDSDCRTYAERFDWKQAASSHMAVYRRAADGQRRRPTRVVYLDHCAQLSGGEISLLRLLPALKHVDAHVILGEDGPLVTRLIQAGISVQLLPMNEEAQSMRRDRVRPGFANLWPVLRAGHYTMSLARWLRRFRPDLVHTNSLKAALYGGAAARMAGIPVVWHVHDRIAPDYLPAPAVKLVRAAGRRLPAAIIANSQATLATLGDTRGRHVAVIHSPVPVPELVARRAHDGLRAAIVGRLARWKGQHIFLEAFAEAFPTGRERAVVVGAPLFGEEDYATELHGLATRLGLDGRVEFSGFRDDIQGELAGVDVLVHASVIPEPFGQVVVEGMACGVPVIAADAGGPAEVVDHEVNGLLYPPGDVGALAHALKRVASDADLRNRLVAAGRAKAKAFAPEAIARQVSEVYEAVLERRRPAVTTG